MGEGTGKTAGTPASHGSLFHAGVRSVHIILIISVLITCGLGIIFILSDVIILIVPL